MFTSKGKYASLSKTFLPDDYQVEQNKYEKEQKEESKRLAEVAREVT